MREWLKKLLGFADSKPARRRRLPKRELAPVPDIVEQELLVADVAIRMAVKNDIIMNALAKRVNFDRHEIRELVVKALTALAEERSNDAQHIASMREEIRGRGRSTWVETAYGGEDSATLSHRQQVYEGVAEKLRERMADEEYLTENVKQAHELAWTEIADSLKNRAEHPYYSGGNTAEYQAEREDRIQQLIAKDLTELVRQQSGKKRRGLFQRKNAD